MTKGEGTCLEIFQNWSKAEQAELVSLGGQQHIFFCDKTVTSGKVTCAARAGSQTTSSFLAHSNEKTSASYDGGHAYRPGGSKFGGHDFRKATNI